MDLAPLWATIDNQIEAVAGLGIPLHSVKPLAKSKGEKPFAPTEKLNYLATI